MKTDPAPCPIRQRRVDTATFQAAIKQVEYSLESRRHKASGNASAGCKSPVRPHQMLASCCHSPPILARYRNGKRAVLTVLPRNDERFAVNRKANGYLRLVRLVSAAKVL